MTSRRGATHMMSTATAGLVIGITMLLIFAWWGYQYSQKTADVRARVAFDALLASYQNCTKVSVGDCYCKVVDLRLLPQDYVIRVVDFEGDMVRFQLHKEEVTRPLVEASTGSKRLCVLTYTQERTGFFEKFYYPTKEYSSVPQQGVLAPFTEYVITPQVNGIALHRSGSDLCFVRDKDFNHLFNDKLSCDAKSRETPFSQLGIVHMVHPSDPSGTGAENLATLQLAEDLVTALYAESKVLSILFTPHLMAEAEDVYWRIVRTELTRAAALVGGSFTGASYFVSVQYHEDDESGKDVIVLHYLKNSQEGKKLAEGLAEELRKIDRKYYDGDVLLQTTDPTYLVDVEVELHEVEDDEEEYLFFADEDYPTYEERESLAGVFVEFIERENSSPLLEHHYDIFAQSIRYGVHGYLSGLLPAPVPLEAEEDDVEPLF